MTRKSILCLLAAVFVWCCFSIPDATAKDTAATCSNNNARTTVSVATPVQLGELNRTIEDLGNFAMHSVRRVVLDKLPQELHRRFDGLAEDQTRLTESDRFWEWGVRHVGRSLLLESGVQVTLHLFFLTQETPSTDCYYFYDILFAFVSDGREQPQFGRPIRVT